MENIKVQKTIDFFFKRKRSREDESIKKENKENHVKEENDENHKKRENKEHEDSTDAENHVTDNTQVNLNKKQRTLDEFQISKVKEENGNEEKEKEEEEGKEKAKKSCEPYINEIEQLMHKEWFDELKGELQKSYFKNMYLRIKEERKLKVIYPPENLVFNAFMKTPLSQVKVVIVGQDPYHQKGQAMGLSFSVPMGIKIPPSLKNMLKEIKQESHHGNLISWSNQGVFLLNSSLTVEDSKPMSHKNYGWERFTDKVIDIINEKRSKIVFMLWGNFAIKKCAKIDTKKHFILKAGHPSPLSIKHFQNCDHFNKCNTILKENNLNPIKWELPQ